MQAPDNVTLNQKRLFQLFETCVCCHSPSAHTTCPLYYRVFVYLTEMNNTSKTLLLTMS